MKTRLFVASAILMCFAVTTLVGADKEDKQAGKTDKLADIKCVVSGKAINPEATVDYKDAKLYFCCEGCPAAFKKDTEKFATKANHQLVATKQYKQEKCPLSGGKLNPEAKVKVAGTAVNFCCEKCQGAVAKAEGDKQLDMVFGDKAFKKAFVVAKKGDKDKKES